MSQTSDTRYDDPFSRPGLRLLDALVRRDAGADERSRIPGGQCRRYVRNVIRIGNNVLGEAAVLRVSAELRLRTYGFARSEAILTVSAGRIKPGHAHPVPFSNRRHARPD